MLGISVGFPVMMIGVALGAGRFLEQHPEVHEAMRWIGAAYMLWLYRRVIFGALTKVDLKQLSDLNWREKLIFAPLLALVLWMGIYPSSFLDIMAPSVEKLIADYNDALAQGTAANAVTAALE